MAHIFPSDEWIAALKEQINSSPAYKESAAAWDAGAVCLVVKANPAVGLIEDQHIYLDLDHGECREAKAVDGQAVTSAAFLITANYDRWKQLFRGELDAVRAMMMGQISIKGNLGVLMKHTQAAKDLLACGGQVPTTFLGE